MQQFQINHNEANQRFDKYLKKLLPQAPGSFIYKMLRKKNITLNGKRASGSEKLSVGDEVKLFFSEETFSKFESPLAFHPDSAQQGHRFCSPIQQKYPYLPLDVRYEDEDILIINKPVGMLSQKAAPGDVSANEYIIGYLLHQKSLAEEQLATFRPSICNRLDRNTSGLLAAGKSLRGLQEMAQCLKGHQIEKYYLCLVKGAVRRPQEIKGWLQKEGQENQVRISQDEMPGSRYIETGYVPLKSYSVKETAGKGNGRAESYTLLEVHLITGRTHQIRAHLASLGHPVLGDGKYGDQGVNRWLLRKFQIHTQLLHACRMEFADGRKVEAPVGEEFQKVLDYLEKS